MKLKDVDDEGFLKEGWEGGGGGGVCAELGGE